MSSHADFPRSISRIGLFLCAYLFLFGTTGLVHAVPVAANIPGDLIPGSVPSVDPGISVLWDVNNDGVNDFNFNFRQPQTVGGVDWQANVFPLNGAGIIGAFDLNSNFYVTHLNSGDTVSNSNTFIGSPVQGIFAENFNGVNGGNFLSPNQQGYLGFSFLAGGNTYYGYLNLQVNRSTGGNFGIDFISATYDNVAGTPITVVIPEPNTLSVLLLGAGGLGLVALRRRQV
jgi:PEP-CTERM motif